MNGDPLASPVAALPKIPGVSAWKLAEIVDLAKEEIVLGLTDSYGDHGEHGEEWGSQWRATEVGREIRYRSGAVRYQVTKATFLSAYNGESVVEVHPAWSFRLDPNTRRAISNVIAKEVRGSWSAKAWFGWIQEYADVDQVGDVFYSTGDARPFNRAGVEGAIKHFDGVYGGEYPVKMRISSLNIREDGTLRVKATLSSCPLLGTRTVLTGRGRR